MKRDARLSVALHVLLHMESMDGAVTSDTLGALMNANPVVVRRTLGHLRDAGILRSEKGHGGGWSLARPLDRITLGEVHDALGMPSPFAIGVRDEAPTCLLEKAVNRAVEGALVEAEALLASRLHRLTVAAIAADAALPPHGVHAGHGKHATHHHPRKGAKVRCST